ncbi:MAG: lipid A export permease/ATP-binding protein MsbA [Pseudomonadota bacterium]|nr:lipid A export permease/ATP-binding protein MsbA [Pseudomonadota bacterium]
MTSAPTNSTSGAALYRRLLGYIGPLWWAFLLSVVGYLLYGAATASFGLVIEIVLSSMTGNEAGESHQVASLSGGLFDQIASPLKELVAAGDAQILIPLLLMGVVLLRTVGGFLGVYFMSIVAWRVVHRLRCEIVDAFLRLPLGYHDRQTSGHLLSTVTFNVTQITAAISDSLTVMLREGAVVVWLVITLLLLDWKLTLIFVAITPLISGVVVFASRYFRRYSKRIQASMGDVTQVLAETLKGLKVIRSFGARRQIADKFTAASERNTRQNLKLALTAAISAPIVHMLVSAAIAFLIWLALDPQALTSMTPERFVNFIVTASMLMKPVRQTSKVNADIQKGLAAAASIFAILDEPGEKDSGTLVRDRVDGRVEFQHVSFAYGAEPVLDDVNLVCEPGKTVAIVGKSGSGKTTLVNLVPRFYELRSGRILIDGIPHSDYTLDSLRHQVALVSQQVVLFNGSIRDNVAYGELAGASDAAIEQALQRAHADEFIRELPNGLDTVVGDDGLLLSGGQRQRLAIARALLKDAPILILDEATSALDTASERHIQDALDTLMRGRTTFVIAHRLSTIEKADLIVVMDKGRIVETGTHQSLLVRGGAYAALHRMQFADLAADHEEEGA